ncbi:MAG: tetratricopeptide repeat protein [Terracidiphilus sp.]
MPVEYEFAEFKADPELRTLWRRGYTVPIQDQPFRLLAFLLSRSGALVTREEIHAHLWPANTNVEFDQSLRVAMSKVREALRDSASEPIYIETLPRRGYRFICPVTVREKPVPGVATAPLPAPSESRLLGPAPGQMPVVMPAETPHPRPSRLRQIRWFALGASVALLVGLGLFVAWRQARRLAQPATTGQAAGRRTVAVLRLLNLNGQTEDQWLSTALVEMFSTELAGEGQLRVLSGEEVARAGLATPAETSPSAATLEQYGRQAGAGILVFGSYAVTRGDAASGPPQLRLDLRLADLSTDAPPVALTQSGLATDLFALVSATGAQMRQRLGVEALSGESLTAVRRTMPASPAAARLFAEGLDHMRDFDPLGARDLLEKAAKLAPEHAGIHLAMAENWNSMGYTARARQEAVRAADLAAGLPRGEYLEIQGEKALLSSDFPGAIDLFHSLLTFYPDSVRYGLLLARAQRSAGRANDALATLADLRRPGIALADELRISLTESNFSVVVGSFPKGLEAADRAIGIARSLNEDLPLADGLWRRANALERMSRNDESLAASRQAQQLYQSAGNRMGLALSLLTSGDVLYAQSKTAEARRDFQKALEGFRAVGNLTDSSLTIERIGNTYYDEGALDKAEENYLQALAGYREVPWNEGIPSALGNLANVRHMRGDLAGALAANSEVLALFEKTGNQRGAMATRCNIADIEMDRGRLKQAEQDYSQCAAVAAKIQYARGLALARTGLGLIKVVRNDAATALKDFEQARKAMGKDLEPGIERSILAGEAEAQRASGHPQQALDLLTRAEVSAAHDADHDALASLSASEAAAALDLKLLDRARAAAQKALTEAHAQSGVLAPMLAAVAMARVQLAQGKSAAARQTLSLALAAAASDGYGPLWLEARLLRARGSEPTQQAKELFTLAQEATSHDWRLLATEAREPYPKR